MNCPVCLNPATRAALTGVDWLFESTAKTFTLNSCASCRCLFLNPMPDEEEIAGFYPPQYWWNSAGSRANGILKNLEALYRKLALHDHVSFVVRASANRQGTEVLDVG
jgi:hypothetical protein